MADKTFPVRVAAWNADGGLGTLDSVNGKAKKAQYLHSLRSHIIFIPEYGWGEPDMSFIGHASCFVQRTARTISGRPKGLAIACATGRLIEYTSNPDKAYLACYWQLGNVRLRVAAVHSQAENYCKNMIDMLKSLRTWLRAGPSLIGGDFNANIALKAGDNKVKGRFLSLWGAIDEAGLSSAWHLLRGRAPSGDDPATLCGRPDDHCKMIDYILISQRHFDVEGCEVSSIPTPSDHKAVATCLRMRISP